MDRLDDLDVSGYLRVDARFSYRPSEHLELVIGVQNATDDQHAEFASSLLSTASELERAFYLGLEWAP